MSHSRAQAGVRTTNNDHNIHTATTPHRFARPANVTEARALRGLLALRGSLRPSVRKWQYNT